MEETIKEGDLVILKSDSGESKSLKMTVEEYVGTAKKTVKCIYQLNGFLYNKEININALKKI